MTPFPFDVIAANAALKEAMSDLDLELVCSVEVCPLTSDYMGYSNQAPYNTLYTLLHGCSGHAFHLWPATGGAGPSVVLIGSEGERAKVGISPIQFLQIALSLAPHYMDAIGSLPALNTLPNEWDIDGATKADFKLDELQARLHVWSQDERMKADIQAARQHADAVLTAVGLERLSVSDALSQLIDTHLSQPRFAIQSEDQM